MKYESDPLVVRLALHSTRSTISLRTDDRQVKNDRGGEGGGGMRLKKKVSAAVMGWAGR